MWAVRTRRQRTLSFDYVRALERCYNIDVNQTERGKSVTQAHNTNHYINIKYQRLTDFISVNRWSDQCLS